MSSNGISKKYKPALKSFLDLNVNCQRIVMQSMSIHTQVFLFKYTKEWAARIRELWKTQFTYLKYKKGIEFKPTNLSCCDLDLFYRAVGKYVRKILVDVTYFSCIIGLKTKLEEGCIYFKNLKEITITGNFLNIDTIKMLQTNCLDVKILKLQDIFAVEPDFETTVDFKQLTELHINNCPLFIYDKTHRNEVCLYGMTMSYFMDPKESRLTPLLTKYANLTVLKTDALAKSDLKRIFSAMPQLKTVILSWKQAKPIEMDYEVHVLDIVRDYRAKELIKFALSLSCTVNDKPVQLLKVPIRKASIREILMDRRENWKWTSSSFYTVIECVRAFEKLGGITFTNCRPFDMSKLENLSKGSQSLNYIRFIGLNVPEDKESLAKWRPFQKCSLFIGGDDLEMRDPVPLFCRDLATMTRTIEFTF